MMRVVFTLVAFCACSFVYADERISNYDIDVGIEPSGSLIITENITVRVEGNQIRRGIYRDFPTRYRDRLGNRVAVDLQVLAVERNGAPEPWFTELHGNGVRINTGNDDFLPQPADYTFTLRYRTTRQLGFFADHDELYWNAIGTGWAFPIEAGSVTVRMPIKMPVEQMSVEAYTGSQGSQGRDYVAELPAPGVAYFRLTRALQSQEGFTVVVTFPKGIVPEPSTAQRVGWVLKDNGGVLVALFGMILLAIFCIREWRRVGRDPKSGVIIARYEPPAGHTPASLRYVMRTRYDMLCFSAEVLALAVAGLLRIVLEKKLLKEEWRLERTSEHATASVPDVQRRLWESLFPAGKSSLELKDDDAYETVSPASTEHAKALDRMTNHRYFSRNGASLVKAVAIAVIAGVVALMVSGGSGVPLIIGICALMLIGLIRFGMIIKAPTLEGRSLMDEIEGLKLYLSVAERDELARMQGPDAPPHLDANRYERLLPFAVALEVEAAWTDKFTAAVGAAAATAVANNIGWYHGGGASDLSGLSHAISSSLTSQIASSSSPPGSSSGSGGGGSSGGGGGGGGGGGR